MLHQPVTGLCPLTILPGFEQSTLWRWIHEQLQACTRHSSPLRMPTNNALDFMDHRNLKKVSARNAFKHAWCGQKSFHALY